jgi:hypothetical protein
VANLGEGQKVCVENGEQSVTMTPGSSCHSNSQTKFRLDYALADVAIVEMLPAASATPGRRLGTRNLTEPLTAMLIVHGMPRFEVKVTQRFQIGPQTELGYQGGILMEQRNRSILL